MPRAIVIIPASHRAACNALVKRVFDTKGGEHTFRVPLVPVNAPADAKPTHYWCCANFDEQRWAMLPQIAALTPRAMVREVDLRAEPAAAEELLTELRLRRLVRG